ncbi:hypothetical protein [Amycolatopsis alkalitolerans]|uniref:Uncharacterized protein n=1 Tax=Amycolatopsis alkalitolerans TaxID=2547244 RepID=A0A5C4M4B1_9PSEU|nr:hypothetical protein [Amycolatopsis alkalitolerans]TNC26424.1 hypothetical protein FG385_11750 [Amycolatopsis alkalitolerans]
MVGWPIGKPKERPTAPLRGYKLAHPVVSADGTGAAFAGVTLGRTKVYGAVADAECAQGGHHQSPSRWCDCGFYCLNTLDDARALACDPDYRNTVLLDIAASGRFRRYERGLRYARQRVSRVRVGRCGCGHPATVFVETGAGSIGWRRLMAVCADCAGSRPGLPLAAFSRLLGGVTVVHDEITRLYDPVRAFDSAVPPPADVPDPAAADQELVPLLAAEIALLQSRLDEVQRQLDRLTKG